MIPRPGFEKGYHGLPYSLAAHVLVHNQAFDLCDAIIHQDLIYGDCSKVGKEFRKTPPVAGLMRLITAICAVWA